MTDAPSTSQPCCSPRVPGAGASLVLLIARLFLGGVLAFAAYNKLGNPQEFAFSIKAFKILPDHLATLATFVLPWMEAISGVLLIVGLWTRGAALVGILQLAAFIAGIASVISRGLDVKCGCFGKYELFCSGPLGWCNLIQNSGLLLVGLVILAFGPGRIALSRR